MKRQWGFNYIMTKKGKQRASADVGLIFCVYNLRRILNLIDKKVLKAWLKSQVIYFRNYTPYFKPISALFFPKTYFSITKLNTRIAA